MSELPTIKISSTSSRVVSRKEDIKKLVSFRFPFFSFLQKGMLKSDYPDIFIIIRISDPMYLCVGLINLCVSERSMKRKFFWSVYSEIGCYFSFKIRKQFLPFSCFLVLQKKFSTYSFLVKIYTIKYMNIFYLWTQYNFGRMHLLCKYRNTYCLSEWVSKTSRWNKKRLFWFSLETRKKEKKQETEIKAEAYKHLHPSLKKCNMFMFIRSEDYGSHKRPRRRMIDFFPSFCIVNKIFLFCGDSRDARFCAHTHVYASTRKESHDKQVYSLW